MKKFVFSDWDSAVEKTAELWDRTGSPWEGEIPDRSQTFQRKKFLHSAWVAQNISVIEAKDKFFVIQIEEKDLYV